MLKETIYGFGNNNYNALNIELKTRDWHSLTSQVSYSWSKQMDTFFGQNGEGGTHALGGQWNPQWSYGPSDANHTNRFVAALTYELPGRNLQSRLLREAFGRWQINSIVTLQTSQPWDAVDTGDDVSNTGEFEDRWDFFGNP